MLRTLCILAPCAPLLTACEADTQPAPRGMRPQVVLQDDRATTDTQVVPVVIHGSYGPLCEGRAGTWSLALDDTPADALAHPALSFDAADQDCALNILTIGTSDGGVHPAQGALLSFAYGWVPVAFGEPAVVALDIRLDQSGASDAVRLTLVLSDVGGARITPNARSESYPGTSRGAAVASPDYVLDLHALRLQTDAHDVVVSVQGGISVLAQVVRGAGYAVAHDAPQSYDAVHAAYARASSPLGDWIPASALALLGADLSTPAVRTVIIANVVSGVPAYQAVAITFAPAQRGAPR